MSVSLIDEATSFAFQNQRLGDKEPTECSSQMESWLALQHAWCATGKSRLDLASRLLEILPDCPDAHFLLSTSASDQHLLTAKRLYETALEAAGDALGPEIFDHGVGTFWQLTETRPYMRARAGLARCLWLQERRQQALEHFFEMLRLNPKDHQGIRYLILTHCLSEQNPNRRFSKFFEYYNQDKAALWLFTNALLCFRKRRAPVSANKLLKKAIRANPFVPFYLLGRKKVPASRPLAFRFGDENEAIDYAFTACPLWRATPDATNWLSVARDFLGVR